MAKVDPRDAMIDELRARLDRLEGVPPAAEPGVPGGFKKFPMMLYRDVDTDGDGLPDHPGNESMTVVNQDELDVAVANGWSLTHRVVASAKTKKSRVLPGDPKPSEGRTEIQPARTREEQRTADRLKAAGHGKPSAKAQRAQDREDTRQAKKQAKADKAAQTAKQPASLLICHADHR
jgi:hypothetical protein